MPVSIGAPKKNPSAAAPAADPLGLFLECHTRIRRFLAVAERLASPPPDATAEMIAEGAADVRRYFSVALPLHEQDEERSLAPRLAGKLSGGAAAALDALAGDHRELEELVGALDRRWRELAGEPERIGTIRSILVEPTARLRALFEAHLAEEEDVLLPAALAVLTPDELAAIRREAEARRT